MLRLTRYDGGIEVLRLAQPALMMKGLRRGEQAADGRIVQINPASGDDGSA